MGEKKKTNKLQVHPYKPVSWFPTHQGILEIKSSPHVTMISVSLTDGNQEIS